MATKPNKTRSLAALLLLLVFALYIAAGAVTYSRFIERFTAGSGAGVAQGLAHYSRSSLTSGGEDIPINDDSEEMVINAIAPNDQISYSFSVADRDGRNYNEVLLRVRVVFSVRLEMLWVNESEANEREIHYFRATEAQNAEDEFLAGGRCSLYVLSETGAENLIAPDDGAPAADIDYDAVDYMDSPADLSQKELYSVQFTENSEDYSYTVYEHMAGFYLRPADSGGAAQEYRFRLDVQLPGEATYWEDYSDARIVIDVRIEAEQMLA